MASEVESQLGQPFDGHEQALFGKLLHAFYWVDNGLQAHMMREAGLSLPRAQSMMMNCISDGITRQTDMAAVLRVSKQAVQQSLKELVAKDFVTIQPDPENGRQKIVRLTAKGHGMRRSLSGALPISRRNSPRALVRIASRRCTMSWMPIGESLTGTERKTE